jgi:cation diffusion facilitator CzcD-associated flavoprotein CzcO
VSASDRAPAWKPAAGEGLPALEAQLRRDLELLCYPPANWVVEHTGDARHDLDVLVIGGGMCGLGAAFALQRLGVRRLRVIEAREPGREGPWMTFARMHNLRSPKHLVGPAQGLPSLTFRAWYEARFGTEAWQALGRIPREQWMDYLSWYREVLDLPVHHGVRVERIRPLDRGERCGFGVRVHQHGGAHTLSARKVVLAMGRESLARARIPAPFRQDLGGRCQHTSEAIDFPALAGKRVAVIGIAASALDNAAMALEAGARVVHVLGRSAAMPRVNKAKSIVYGGFTEGFPALPDVLKIELLDYIARERIPAPRDTVLRVARHAAFDLRLGWEVRRVTASSRALTLHCDDAELSVDHVILGTGFRIDLEASAEIAELVPEIARWRDRVTPPPGLAGSEHLDFPYLGEALEFLPREPGAAPYLADLHCFSQAAALSHGNVSGDIPAVSDGAQRLARGIARGLFLADRDDHRRRLFRYADPELLGDELDIEHWHPPL